MGRVIDAAMRMMLVQYEYGNRQAAFNRMYRLVSTDAFGIDRSPHGEESKPTAQASPSRQGEDGLASSRRTREAHARAVYGSQSKGP